ncbi:hypothetical protein CL616_04815 [archaeon]|nr:hypothetical protein [archaeon]
MKVTELTDKGKVDEITLEIVSKEEPREIRSGLSVCNFKGKDDSGEVTVTLWNADIEKVKQGDTIVIKGGWSQEYQGNMQVSPGKFGTLEISS